MAWELLGTALSPSCSQQVPGVAQLSWRQKARRAGRGQGSVQDLGAQGKEDFVHTPPPCPLPGPQQALVQLCCHSLPGRCFRASVSPLMEIWTGTKCWEALPMGSGREAADRSLSMGPGPPHSPCGCQIPPGTNPKLDPTSPPKPGGIRVPPPELGWGKVQAELLAGWESRAA